ncbi:siderophore-interacting protein [Nocardioides sp.]|uniref:siderophore-interacting protein n=1 Tax=Nocardioides sp. TaxID=35761 RepID=UPI003D0D8990
MTTTQSDQRPMICDEVEVRSIERLSPTYVRVEFGGDALADFGVDGPLYDQRIKLVFPTDSGSLPSFADAEQSWVEAWMAQPPEERGHMRTYTVRAVRGEGRDTRIVVDFVLHLAEGATGPASTWAAGAGIGDRLMMIAPRRGMPFGGIEFDPAGARTILLVADETAVPAVSSILDSLPDGTRGHAFLEVPLAGDVLDVRCPVGMEIVWLPRSGDPLGEPLRAAVLAHLGVASPAEPFELEVDDDLWETPAYSSSGEEILDQAVTVGHDLDGLYAWIAGESAVVTGLRRHLVNELGMDRRQVAFMGYWRRGVAMRS